MMGFAALYPSYIGVESSRGWRLRLGRSTCRAATDRADDSFGQLRFRERLGQVGLGALAHAPDAVGVVDLGGDQDHGDRSEEQKSGLQALMRITYDVFGLKKSQTPQSTTF